MSYASKHSVTKSRYTRCDGYRFPNTFSVRQCVNASMLLTNQHRIEYNIAVARANRSLELRDRVASPSFLFISFFRRLRRKLRRLFNSK